MLIDRTLDYDKVREIYTYRNGKLYWRIKQSQKTIVGQEVGSLDHYGYIQTSYSQKKYKLHRLVWLYCKGVMPKYEIDHINGDRSDNRIENLRDVKVSENRLNLGQHKGNKSGYKGVSWCKRDKMWLAQVAFDKKSFNLGRYKQIDDAVSIAQSARLQLGFSGRASA